MGPGARAVLTEGANGVCSAGDQGSTTTKDLPQTGNLSLSQVVLNPLVRVKRCARSEQPPGGSVAAAEGAGGWRRSGREEGGRSRAACKS